MPGNNFGVAYERFRIGVGAANPVLLFAGLASMVVAAVGLFVRASPTLSGAFLVAGTLMLIVGVLVPPATDGPDPNPTRNELDLELLEQHAHAAESEVERGEVHAIAGAVRAFVAKNAEKELRRSDPATAIALAEELAALPTLEETSRKAPVPAPPAGYRSLTLPSGYVVLYRRLTPVEIHDATGAYSDEDAYLVADLVSVVHPAERQ
jgi:hypothetical protein